MEAATPPPPPPPPPPAVRRSPAQPPAPTRSASRPSARSEYNRFLPLVKWLLAFPHYIVLFFVGIGAFVHLIARSSRFCSPAAARAGCSTSSSGSLRWAWRVVSATSSCSPTSTRRSRSTTIPSTRSSLEIDYPEHVNNWRPLVHWLLIIPYFFVAYVLVCVAGDRRLLRHLRDPVHEAAPGGDVRPDRDPDALERPAPAPTVYWTWSTSTQPSMLGETRAPSALGGLLAEHLDHEPLRPAAVELEVEDRLPRAEVEPALGHRDDHLVVDEQVLEVRVAVVLAAAVVAVVAGVG